MREPVADIDLPSASAVIRERINRLRGQLGETGGDENLRRFRRMLEARVGGDAPVPWSEFRQRLEVESAGFVLTAHPTFSLSSEARDCANAVLAGQFDEKHDTPEPSQLHPDSAPSLDDELVQSEQAATNIRLAIRQLYRTAIDIAAERYPDDWRGLVPGFCTIASWVGFDLDGRTDIGWETSLRFRYVAALKGLEQLEALAADIEAPLASLTALNDGLKCFRSCFELGASTLSGIGAEAGIERAGLARLNSLAMEKRPEKEAAITSINDALSDLMASDLPLEALKAVALLRAEWQSMGLGLNHIHFRLNAVQLHNAIRSEIKLDRAPDESASRRHYLAEISALLDRAKPVNVHYGTLAREGTTAKRLFMLAAQFEKHFDRHTPIRLLVAESDTPFTLLTALYYARLFNVEDHVEISPLFETSSGLARGDRVIAELLDNPHFLKYLQNQGRFCVQLGFSDSGRYIGQPAATLAIERFKLRLIQLWKARNLGDIQLVFFDTHGESIGRGAHPGGLRQRFLYTHSPKVRAEIKSLSAPHKHEVSFQGGDGYLWFQTADDTLATLVNFMDVRHVPVDEIEDELYARSDWSLDFFLTLKEYQDQLVADPGYIALIDSFGPGLLFPTGSRAVVRQGGSGKISRLEAVTQLRAIPHNAILQQLGYLANVVAGAGTAISRSPEGFDEVLENSERLQLIMTLVGEAYARSDIRILAAYIDLIRPDAWLAYADENDDERRRNGALRLSRILEGAFDHEAISALLREIQRDEVKYRAFAARFAPESEKRGAEVLKSNISTLHAARIECVKRLYLLAMEIPRFSSRSDISLDDLMERLLRLDVPETLAQLRKIFPTSSELDDDEVFGEDSDYATDTGGYADLHRDIFDPIRTTYEEILEYSARIALEIGAVG